MDNKVIIIKQLPDLIAYFKPAGMPVQADTSGDPDLLSIAAEEQDQSLHLINRLDRPVSGVVLVTKEKRVYTSIKEKWSTSVQKTYLAITEGHWEQTSGTLKHFLIKGRGAKAIAHKKGKPAELDYEVIKALDNYSILKITLKTGRFHQIRAQLSLAGHPIKGDVKYGARRKNQDRSIHLICHEIVIDSETFTAEIPETDNLWKEVNNLR